MQQIAERVGTDAPHPQRLTVTCRAAARATVRDRTGRDHGRHRCREISDVDSRGRGEGVPLRRYGESIDSVVAALNAMKGAVFSGLNRDTLQHALPPGAARNALDCAFWDIDAKRAYCSVAELAGLGPGVGPVPPLMTAFTVAFDAPSKMAELAAANRTRPLLNGTGGNGDERVRAVRCGAGGAPHRRCQRAGMSVRLVLLSRKMASSRSFRLVRRACDCYG